MHKKKALIAGATGLVGSHLLDLLLQDPDYEQVVAIARHPIEGKGEKLVNLVLDFDKLPEFADQLTGDDVYCCLGTTMKQAGSKEKFRKVDYEYPLAIASYAYENGAQQYLLISALGATSRSSIFYNRVKGEVEEAIGRLGYHGFHIFRPALLMGSRKEARQGEDAAKTFFKVLGFLFVGPLKKYQAIDSIKVAMAMHTIAKQQIAGLHIHESKELQNF